MISTNDLFPGATILIDDQIHEVVEYQHVKPGKGQAFVRTRLRNLESGGVFERTLRAGVKIPQVHVESQEVQYLYRSDDVLYFMDTQTFDQFPLDAEQVGEGIKFLKESIEVKVVRAIEKDLVLRVELPTFVQLEVVETEPGMRGDTVSGATKPATLETGVEVQVPLFIDRGDILKIDTRTGEYMERV